MAVEQVVVPDIGGAEDAEVIELLVAAGDTVAVDQSLIVLESDKASMEIPSTLAGKIVEVLVNVGDQLSENSPVVSVETDQQEDGAEVSEATQEGTQEEAKQESDASADDVENSSPSDGEDRAEAKDAGEPSAAGAAGSSSPASKASEPARSPGAETASAEAQTTSAAAQETSAGAQKASAPGIYAGPAVRKLAREFGVSLESVSGSGPHGRILKEDLQQYVAQSLAEEGGAGSAIPEVPEVDHAKFGPVEITARSKIDKVTAKNMHRSWLNVPHVTQFDDADITELEAFRKQLKDEATRREVKLSPVPFILKACAVALTQNPKLNSALANNGDDLVLKQYVHIGMAVDTPAGLVVPVLRDVDRKSVWELAAEVAELAASARERKLTPAQMQGGCFTVSSLGNIGGQGFTPIVNSPEVGILGVSQATIKPVWNGTEFAPRTMLPLALSYDHRVVNGGDGGRFLSQVVALLSDIRLLSM